MFCSPPTFTLNLEQLQPTPQSLGVVSSVLLCILPTASQHLLVAVYKYRVFSLSLQHVLLRLRIQKSSNYGIIEHLLSVLDLREIHRLERLGFRFTELCAKFRIGSEYLRIRVSGLGTGI